MEKDTRTLTAVGALSFIAGMLVAFVAVVVAVVVTKPCGESGFDAVRRQIQMVRHHQEGVKREAPIIIVQQVPAQTEDPIEMIDDEEEGDDVVVEDGSDDEEIEIVD